MHNLDIIGQKGINVIERIVLEMGFMWTPTNLEAGIDGYIEIRDESTGEVTNSIIQVQSKATERGFQAETDTGFEYVCREKDLNYWLGGNAPVILICSKPDTGEAYWVLLKDYFQDAQRRRCRKVHFDKQRNRFDASSRQRLVDMAIPKDAGIYLPSLPRTETLFSNLLSVEEFPRRLFCAKTRFTNRRALWAKLRTLTDKPRGDWILHEGGICSFFDLTFKPWSRVCYAKATENRASREWALSEDISRRNLFAELLNRCLREMVAFENVGFCPAKDCYYFRGTPDLNARKLGSMTVFKGYQSKTTPDRMAYYRHRAFRGQFYRFGNCWYLEITPTYHFTQDGYRLSRYYEERLSGIKLLERQNKGHLAQVRIWADLLKPKANMFEEPYAFLRFGKLRCFEVAFGIDDAAWLPEAKDSKPANTGQLWLFE